MIELQNDAYRASVDPRGGWLVSFSDARGDILFSLTEITYPDGSVKLRGGSHVCLPNFGPGGQADLAQHGFGRTLAWEVESRDDTSVTLLLNGGTEAYKNLVSRLTYTLTPHGLRMELNLENIGESPLPIAPGFHPYFRTSADDTTVIVKGNELAIDELSDMKLIESDDKDLFINNRRLRLSSPMKFWAHWTDRAGEYLCIEPTLRGNAFEDSSYYILDPASRYETYLSIDIL